MNSAVDVSQTPPVRRVAKFSEQAKVLGEIYQPECNLAVWQRGVEVRIKQYLDAVAATGLKIFLRSLISTGDEMATNLQSELGRVLPKLPDEREAVGRQMLMDNVLELFEMYECLFEAKEIGVRMASLDKAMCAKFHVDRLPARLVTCYSGEGTHWLSEPPVGGKRIPDEEPEVFNQIDTGDVALLKGEGWFENEGFGLVHRSPPVAEGTMRVFLSLDFVS